MIETFQERMVILVKLAGNAMELARRTGISRRAIGMYLSGDADPTRSKLIAMAEAVEVTVEWLATGIGPMRRGGGSEQNPSRGLGGYPEIQAEMVLQVLNRLEGYLFSQAIQIAPDKKARLVGLLCQNIAEQRRQQQEKAKTTPTEIPDLADFHELISLVAY